MGDVTELLAAGHNGEPRGSDELLPLVYGELRQLAARRLADEKSHRTFTATCLTMPMTKPRHCWPAIRAFPARRAKRRVAFCIFSGKTWRSR